MSTTRRRGRATKALRALAATAALAVALPVGAQAQSAPGAPDVGRAAAGLKEVDRLPLWFGDHNNDQVEASGWLILDTRNRLGYQVLEGGATGTTVQLFDLDTLRHRRTLVLAGVPVTSGIADSAGPGGTQHAGEIVHAVDEGTGRLYLAMSEFGFHTVNRFNAAAAKAYGQRPYMRFVMVDGPALARGDADVVASFREPANHAHLHFHYVLALTVTRHHVPAGRPGRLLVTFAQPSPTTGDVWSGYGHVVAQWDVSGLVANAGDEGAPSGPTGFLSTTEVTTPPLVVPGEERMLQACAASSMGAWRGETEGNLQWELLATPDALFTACQAASNVGVVVEVPLGEGGSLVTPEPLRTYPLAKAVADVLVDPGGGRLLLRVLETQGNVGGTVWVFDTRKRAYTGAVALKQAIAGNIALGLSPATGRLYALVPDYAAQAGGSTIPTRGGLQVSDTRLDPAPPLENVLPEEAYPAKYRIRVDPPTRRVFVRRGHISLSARIVYPSTSINAPAETDPFYRVFRDDIPVADRPPEIDDTGFTTDVAESDLTRASFLGDGSGFGSRQLLIGGADAATGAAVSGTTSPCGKDDREVVAGSVGSVSLSDLSATAEAAALDADARTQKASPDLLDACGPGATAGRGAPGTEQAAFDRPDGEGGRTGENHWAATCLDDDGTRRQKGFSDADAKTGREAFEAEVRCARSDERASGSATGVLSPSDTAPDEAATATGAVPVRVAQSTSEVTVTRRPGEGVEVRVDSVARGVVIAGVGTIAVVRAEAVSTATGRSARARGSFRRDICGVVLERSAFVVPGCLEGDQQQAFVRALNDAMAGRGKARLRQPDAALAAGSASGYRSAVVRDRDEGFEDRSITKDDSPAVPGLELVFYVGDGDARWGSGRQVVQLAGVAASTSYGITCAHGQIGTGRCAKPGEAFEVPTAPSFDAPGPSGPGTERVVTDTVTVAGEPLPGAPGSVRTRTVPRWRTLLEAVPRALAEAVRLAFNNPRELGLLAAVWALLYAPCYLAERRRSVGGLRSLRATA